MKAIILAAIFGMAVALAPHAGAGPNAPQSDFGQKKDGCESSCD